jgi:hypothetical protein
MREVQADARAVYEKDASSEFEMAISDLRKFNQPKYVAAERGAFLKEFGFGSKTKCATAMMQAWKNQRTQPYGDLLANL